MPVEWDRAGGHTLSFRDYGPAHLANRLIFSVADAAKGKAVDRMKPLTQAAWLTTRQSSGLMPPGIR